MKESQAPADDDGKIYKIPITGCHSDNAPTRVSQCDELWIMVKSKVDQVDLFEELHKVRERERERERERAVLLNEEKERVRGGETV